MRRFARRCRGQLKESAVASECDEHRSWEKAPWYFAESTTDSGDDMRLAWLQKLCNANLTLVQVPL